MKNTISDILHRAGVPSDQLFFFISLTERLTDGDRRMILALADRYETDGQLLLSDLSPALCGIAARLNVHPSALQEIFLALLSERLENTYRSNGIPAACFDGILTDLRCKTEEGLKRFGCFGNGSFGWYDGFFRLQRFVLGRLQFEKGVFADYVSAYNGQGLCLRPGDPVIRIHIPSSGKLDRPARLDAYRQAFGFFPEYRQNGVLPLTCCSWLLCPDNRALFSEKSNVMDFMNDFEILASWENTTDSDIWRVFGTDFTDFSLLPETTSLQKNLAARLRAGGHLGVGFGVIGVTG